ncbi:MAG: cell division protein SepF [Ruminococcaceae bacterium]|nr:cell division protein SepF [Oscillospiraceae bacterium]
MGAMNKMLKWIGLADDVDADETVESSMAQAEEEPAIPAGKRGKVVNIHSSAQMKVVVMQLSTFEDARDIADHLKAKKPVVINLEKLDKDVSRRVVDFLSGAVYGVDGNIQKVANGIFLIAPYNVGIMGDFKDELKIGFPFSY